MGMGDGLIGSGQQERRIANTAVVERVAKMEGEVTAMAKSLSTVERSVGRVHERLDSVVQEIQEVSKVFEKRLRTELEIHVQQEEKLAEERNKTDIARYLHLERTLDKVACSGENRLEVLQSGLLELKNSNREVKGAAVKIGITLIGVFATTLLTIITFLITHYDKIIFAIEKLGK